MGRKGTRCRGKCRIDCWAALSAILFSAPYGRAGPMHIKERCWRLGDFSYVPRQVLYVLLAVDMKSFTAFCRPGTKYEVGSSPAVSRAITNSSS